MSPTNGAAAESGAAATDAAADEPPLTRMPAATLGRSSRLWLVLGVFLSIQGLILALALGGLTLVNDARSYVAGEGSYSKAQKSAVIALYDYIRTGDPAHHARFKRAIAVPLGDRAARRALAAEPPDPEAARRGFLAGNNDPRDIPGMIRTFRLFADSWVFAPAVAIWRAADREVLVLDALAGRVHAEIGTGGLPPDAARAYFDEIGAIDDRLTDLEAEFSAIVGERARTATRVLTWALIGASLLLWTSGGAWAHHVFRGVVRAEAALGESEQRLRDIVDTTSDWITETDAEGRYTYISHRFERVTGIPAENLIGKRRDEIVIPVDPDRWKACKALIAARKPFRDLEYRIVASLGGGDRRFRVSGRPVFDADGTFRGYRGAGRDVTEEVAAREAAETQRLLLETTFEHIDQGISVIDSNLKSLAFNRRFLELLEFPMDRFKVGDPFEAFIRFNAERGEYGPGDVEALTAERVETARKFEPHRFERARPDGRVIEISGQPMPNGGFVTTYTDVTERRRTEAKLRETAARAEAANRSKDEFLANMSHELRTPLNAIIGFAEVMESQQLGALSERYRGYSSDIKTSGRHLLSVINDLLDLSKIAAGKLDMSPVSFDLADLAAEAVRLLGPFSEERGISLESTVEPPLEIRADRARLLQVLTNLLTNAVKYNRPEGWVRLSAERTPDGVSITVVDGGFGMREADIPRALAKFGRLTGGDDPHDTGAGLGLPIVQRLVELHEGHLDIRSELGRGTTVTVTLPG